MNYLRNIMNAYEPMNKWSNATLMNWVNGLQTINDRQKAKIIKGITEFGVGGAEGKHIFDAEIEDLADSFEINGMLARLLYDAIGAEKSKSFYSHQYAYNIINNPTDSKSDEGTFSVNLEGLKNGFCRIDKLKSSYTVKYLKERYLEYYGHDLKNAVEKRKGLSIYRVGTKLADETKTLAFYNITNDIITLDVIFRVDGGMEQKMDAYKVRKLRYKKYKQIQLSNEPDCLMGYTNKDGIKRAKMPCLCSFAAETMYRYMVSLFDKDNNFREVTMKCPMPSNICKGSAKQRQWDWALVFIIADLTDTEKRKYSQIITNRIAGIRQCPHCGANCERGKDLKIFRVKCSSCNKGDWCWECAKPWKGGGLTVCGNDNCTAERLNKILSNAEMIPVFWSSDEKVPSIRHCPKCLTLIEYVAECRHMTCVGCEHQFCFKCLGKWEGHSNEKCITVAKNQIIK